MDLTAPTPRSPGQGTPGPVCADPFHVVKLANTALDEARRAEWNKARRAGGIDPPGVGDAPRTIPAAQLAQAHPLGAAQGPRHPHRPPTRPTR